jgi:hypothetical protein
MREESLSPKEKEIQFFKMIVAEYLKYGSVDEVFRRHEYSLPISYMGFHRVLDKWGIMKAAGPNSKLSEVACFLTTLSQEKIPLEKLYSHMPPSFQVSMSTLHRVLHCIKEEFTRRVGTALMITTGENQDQVLVGNDVSTPRLELGKTFGSLSLPMGYSKAGESSFDSILRVLQQEVFTLHTVEEQMPEIIQKDPKAFMDISLLDVKVAVYHLPLPVGILGEGSFSSFKLENLRFAPVAELIEKSQSQNLRAGMVEIFKGYQRYLKLGKAALPFSEISLLNQELGRVALELLEPSK